MCRKWSAATDLWLCTYCEHISGDGPWCSTKDTGYFGEEKGYYTLDEKTWVFIHYLEYTLGLAPVLTRDFSPADLVSSPFYRGQSVSYPQNVYFIQFWCSPLSNDKLFIEEFFCTHTVDLCLCLLPFSRVIYLQKYL